MVVTMEISILIKQALLTQIETLAQELDISQDQLFEIAMAQYIKTHQAEQISHLIKNSEKVAINQGDIYWVQFATSDEAESSIPHPHVVIQDNLFNHSRIHTVIVCALTSNIKKTGVQGTILLDMDEANLPKQSIVEVAKVSTIDKAQLGEYIGTLNERRVNQILAGMRFLQSSYYER